MTEKISLQFKWRKTWPDAEDDFSGHDGAENIGRIYMHKHGPQKGAWYWSMTANLAGRMEVECEGCEETAREAAKRIESAYLALR